MCVHDSIGFVFKLFVAVEQFENRRNPMSSQFNINKDFTQLLFAELFACFSLKHMG